MKIKKIKSIDPEYLKLRSMWHEVFGDEPGYIDSLYNELDAEGYIGYLLEEPSQIVTSLTIYDVGQMKGKDVVAVYAVCTATEYRGHGYASQLVKEVVQELESAGKLALTSPAEASLQDFYKKLGFDDELYVDELCLSSSCEDEFTAEDFDDEEGEFMPLMKIKVEQISAERYDELREAFLVDYPHVKLNTKFLEFIRSSESYDGNGLLMINGGDAICVLADSDADETRLTELLVNPRLETLSSEISESIAIGLAELFETESISYRTKPSIEGGVAKICDKSGTKLQSLLSGNEALKDAYFGFPID